jgi:hypothetical protein
MRTVTTTTGTMLRDFGRSGLLSLQAISLAVLVVAVSPAAGQAPSDVVSRLQSLPQTLPLQRYRYFYEQRAFPFGQIPPGAYQAALADHEQKFGPIRQQQPAGAPPPMFPENQWQSVGPTPIGDTPTVSDRTNTIAIDPTNTNNIYIGAATGGVWKSTDRGNSWTPLTDTQCSVAMGSIAIDPSNPQVVYAGTGEQNFSADSYYAACSSRPTAA